MEKSYTFNSTQTLDLALKSGQDTQRPQSDGNCNATDVELLKTKKRLALPQNQNLSQIDYICTSPEETHNLGKVIAKSLSKSSIIAFFGDLGTGKTTFIRGIAEGIGGIELKNVCSPTFNFLNIYEGKSKIFHFDLYRIPREEEFLAAGFDEYFYAEGICCIEWAEKISSLLPSNIISVTFSYLEEGIRKIQLSGELI